MTFCPNGGLLVGVLHDHRELQLQTLTDAVSAAQGVAAEDADGRPSSRLLPTLTFGCRDVTSSVGDRNLFCVALNR
jgi:hypothetical protein